VKIFVSVTLMPFAKNATGFFYNFLPVNAVKNYSFVFKYCISVFQLY
jgi:hypothetical protein